MWFALWFCFCLAAGQDLVLTTTIFHSEYFSTIKLSNSAVAVLPGDHFGWALLDLNYTAVWSIQVCCLSEWKPIAMIYSMKGSVHRTWRNRKYAFYLKTNAYKNNRMTIVYSIWSILSVSMVFVPCMESYHHRNHTGERGLWDWIQAV